LRTIWFGWNYCNFPRPTFGVVIESFLIKVGHSFFTISNKEYEGTKISEASLKKFAMAERIKNKKRNTN